MGDVFPTSPAPTLGYSAGQAFETYEASYPSGRSIANRARYSGLYRASLTYTCLQPADVGAVLALHAKCRGRYSTFTFVHPRLQPWYKLYVGVGAGAEVNFDIPLSTTTALTVYVAGSATTAYTLGSGTGTDGRDRLTFTAPPAAGAVIEIDATGYRRAYCRFASDELRFQDYETYLALAVDIIEVVI